MKILLSVLLAVLLTAANITAQTSPTVSVPPDIIVVKKNWRLVNNSSLLDYDPFEANAQFNDAMRAQRNSDIQNAIRAKGSESREPPPPPPRKTSSSPAKPQVTYVYSAKIRNAGVKTIRSVEWAYLFLDPDTQAELGRHRYSSKVQIRPGQSDKLVGHSTNSQTYTVNAKSAGKGLGEQIVIYRVEYDDGSVWQNPAK
jgi:hypothetical protein